MAVPISLGNYWLYEVLGRGQFGVVYRAQHKRSDQQMAYKLMPKFCQDPERFQSEMSQLKQLQHPNVVQVVDSLIHAACKIISGRLTRGYGAAVIMELGEQDLGKWFKQLNLGKKLKNLCVFNDICHGLQYLHERDILHGDIKPANIIMGDHRTMLSDFGVSDADGRMIIGRSKYAAPEAHHQENAQHLYSKASDIFSLGILLVQFYTEADQFRSWMYGKPQFPILYDVSPFVQLPAVNTMGKYVRETVGLVLRFHASDRIGLDELIQRIWTSIGHVLREKQVDEMAAYMRHFNLN